MTDQLVPTWPKAVIRTDATGLARPVRVESCLVCKSDVVPGDEGVYATPCGAYCCPPCHARIKAES